MRRHVRMNRVVLSADDRELLDRRLRFALSRYADRVRAVTVDLRANVASNLEHITCEIQLELLPAHRLQVKVNASSPLSAVERALARLERALARHLDSERLTGRG